MARIKYKIEMFTSEVRKPNVDRYFWHVKAGGKIISSSEGIARRNTRDRIAMGLYEAIKPGMATIVDLDNSFSGFPSPKQKKQPKQKKRLIGARPGR